MQSCVVCKEPQFCKVKRALEVGCTTTNALNTSELKPPPPLKDGQDGKLSMYCTTVSKMKKDLKTYTRDAKHFSCQLYSIVCGCLGHRLERGWERGCWDGGEETHTSSSCWGWNIPIEGRNLEVFNRMPTPLKQLDSHRKLKKSIQGTHSFSGLFALHTSAWPLQTHRPPMLISFML